MRGKAVKDLEQNVSIEIQSLFANIGDSINSALINVANKVKESKVGEAFRSVSDGLGKVAQPFKVVFSAIKGVSVGLVKQMGKVFKRLGSSKVGKAFKKFGEVIKGIGGMLGKMAESAGFAEPFKEMVDRLNPMAILLEVMAPIIEVLNGLISAFIGAIKSEAMPSIQKITNVLLKLLPYVIDLGTFVGKYLVIGMQKLWEGMKWAYENVIKPITPLLMVLWEGIKWAYENVLKPVFNGIVNLFKWIKDNWDEYFAPVLNMIVDFFVSIAEGVIGLINSMITGINKILPEKWEIGTIDLPSLAEGGIVPGPMMAQIGDAGPTGKGAEAVIPLDAFNERQDEMIEELKFSRRINQMMLQQMTSRGWDL